MESAIFGLIGVVIGAILATTKDWWFEHRRRGKDLQYLSIHVICMLDNFVANCIEVTLDDGLAYGSRDKDGCKRPQVEHPTIDLKSLDVEWKSLPSDLMYKILNFPTLIADANSYISAVLDYEAGPPDYEEFFEARTVKYAELGLLAISIIETLRKKCNWPEDVTHEEGWSPKERLSKARKKILDSIERRKLGNHHLLSHLTKGDDKA